MKQQTILPLIILLFSCSNEKAENTATNSKPAPDSREIIGSKEYLRVIAFLDWYKEGYDKLRLSRVEQVHQDGRTYYAYIDSSEARELLLRYRQSGYFSENYLKTDSLYIEEAKKAYAGRNLEVYDYFDHDFVFLTQETESCLNEKAYIAPLPQYCAKKQIALSIANCSNLKFSLVEETGLLKIDRIENLGNIHK